EGLQRLGHRVVHESYFDTLRVEPRGGADAVMEEALARGINLRRIDEGTVGVALDETVTAADLADLLAVFNGGPAAPFDPAELAGAAEAAYPAGLARTSAYLTHPVFNTHHSETEMLRYMRR